MPLAGQALDTHTDDPRVADRVLLTACERALAAGALPAWAPRLRRAQRTARKRLLAPAPGPLSRWQRRCQETTVTLATACLAFGPVLHHDDELVALFADCIAAAAPPSVSGDDRPEAPALRRRHA